VLAESNFATDAYTTVDESRSALVAQVGPPPLCNDQETIAKTNQPKDMDEEPEDLGRQPGNLEESVTGGTELK